MYKRQNYSYELPKELIAERPTEERDASRLLTMYRHGSDLQHGQFTDLINHLKPQDLLVFNNTKVLPARLFGTKHASGGTGEALMERILPGNKALCQLKFSRLPKVGQLLIFTDTSGKETVEARVSARSDDFFELEFLSEEPVVQILERVGSLPLPPYINRPADAGDVRYQTLYASRYGAVAAPTAGLHFSAELLKALSERGIGQCELTLHVGAGTFQPVRVDDIRQHKMHTEWCEISARTVAKIEQHQRQGGRVIAVGTTSVRVLESAIRQGRLHPGAGETDIFIYPPYNFAVVDGMITNFHMSQSTLLMLVCAFAGFESIMAAYADAIAKRYRFLSYGDAMLILPDADRDQADV